MSENFWKKLPKPFFILAPMANVTDVAFREIIAKYGKPHVMITEFVSCNGLCSSGKEKLLPDLWFTERQRPIVAQIFGSVPKHFFECARLLRELGFDGIDVNMGCPDKKIEKQGGGAALMKDPRRAQEIIRATQKGAEGLPVSVKTRLGYSTVEIREWLPYIFEAEPAALTIHGRTRKEMSKVPAHWDAIGEVVEMAKTYTSDGKRPKIIGNGDVTSLEDAREKARQYGVDGVMVGRAVFGNPWFFGPATAKRSRHVSLKQKLRVLYEHTKLFEKKFCGIKSFEIMKKHYKAYVSGFAGAKELRLSLMSAKNSRDVQAIIKDYFSIKSCSS